MNELQQSKLLEISSDEMQLKALKSTGSAVVIAGPGSGKTAILTLKALRLLETRILEPQGLACITYSREAAREIRDRLKLFGYVPRSNAFFGTVHAFCIAEVLSPFAKLFDHFSLSNPIRIASTKERKAAYTQALRKLVFMEKDVSMTEMDRERRIGVLGDSKISIPSYDLALQVAREYEIVLHAQGLIDFEDIVNYSTLLIRQEEFVRKCLEAKFPWLLVDEYQDLGKPLHEMVLSLLLRTRMNIFAVGDPDQSIYGFQGAIPEYLTELASFSRIEKIVLGKNYRSNQDIVNASEAVLELERGYVAGTRKQERAEIRFHVCEVGMEEQYSLVSEQLIPEYISRGIPYDEIAVIVGSNKEVSVLSDTLQNHGIPYYVSRHEFERTELVQWLEDCCRWTINSHQVQFEHLCSYWGALLAQNQGAARQMDISDRVSLYTCLARCSSLRDDLKKWLESMVDGLGIRDLLARSTIFPDELENLDQLMEAVEERKERFSLKGFAELGRPTNQVTISTRHGCKGLEFEVVIMLGMEEERFPSYYDLNSAAKLAESSRICFVCVSRAKRICVLVRSKVHILSTRRGPWEKPYDESRYWTSLESWQKSSGRKTNAVCVKIDVASIS